MQFSEVLKDFCQPECSSRHAWEAAVVAWYLVGVFRQSTAGFISSFITRDLFCGRQTRFRVRFNAA